MGTTNCWMYHTTAWNQLNLVYFPTILSVYRLAGVLIALNDALRPSAVLKGSVATPLPCDCLGLAICNGGAPCGIAMEVCQFLISV